MEGGSRPIGATRIQAVARRVKDPRGGEWIVRRRWLEHRRRLVGSALTRPQPQHSGQAFAFVLFLPFGAAWLLLTIFDLGRGVIARAAGSPWTVEARRNALKREQLVWRVVGWSQSRRALEEAVSALSRGDELTSFGEPERTIVR